LTPRSAAIPAVQAVRDLLATFAERISASAALINSSADVCQADRCAVPMLADTRTW
jgi:hypothetical protein